ncbi:MAG: ROK family protein [Bacteroidales bacterium]|nr:ROK family protein [Bacteroidales bacterium]
MVEQFVVGVDVGGQTSKIGVVNAAGEILSQSVIRSDVYGSDADAFLSALADAIKANIADSGKEGQIKGVGVGAPNANYYTGTVSYAPNLAWAADKEVKFAEELSAKLGGIPVILTNDANAAAVGEMTYGVAQDLKHFIMITLGTGVGSGIIVNGQLLYGHDGFAGELGHTKVQENGRLCGCGGKGCLEAYCSATGVARTAREILDTTEEPSLLRSLDNITSKDVYDAAKEGDAVAMKIFDFTARLLGKSLANFVSFSSPQAIVLFGGLARAKEFLYEPMMEAMNENLLHQWKGKIQILFSSLKESDAAILGASSLAW